jgi:hypothetical protein
MLSATDIITDLLTHDCVTSMRLKVNGMIDTDADYLNIEQQQHLGMLLDIYNILISFGDNITQCRMALKDYAKTGDIIPIIGNQ